VQAKKLGDGMQSRVDSNVRRGARNARPGVARTATGRFTPRLALAGIAAVTFMAIAMAACSPAMLPAPGTTPSKATLNQVKRTEFGRLALDDSALIAAGEKEAVLDFTVEDTPPSIFINQIVPDDKAEAFAAAASLPQGFSLAKVRILESDPVERFWLSVNVYRVSGLTTGLRTEWSTYVDDGSGVPRFMILRARASEGSLDPIGPLAPPEPFTHLVDPAGVIRTDIRKTVVQNGATVLTPNNMFSSTVALPEVADRQYVLPTRQWVAANDFIYWRNGVNDRVFHNSTSHSPQLISVDLGDVTLQDDTEWAPFVDPIPGHVLVYLDKIKFKIGPWWNITQPDGRVDPTTLASLQALKKTLYGGLTSVSALQVLSGAEEPLVQSSVEGSPAAVNWHWKIPADKLAAFTAAAHLPAGLTLSTVHLQEGDAAAEHWLTLNVHADTGGSSGLRAEWSTYVTDGVGLRKFVLESRAGYRSLDPVNLFSDPYPIAHTVGPVAGDTVVATSIGSGGTAFSSSFALPEAGPSTAVVATREWVGSSDLRYWRNGVADREFYESSVLDPKTAVDPATVSVTDGSAWSAFVGATPDRVWVDRSGTDTVTNPWFNLKGL